MIVRIEEAVKVMWTTDAGSYRQGLELHGGCRQLLDRTGFTLEDSDQGGDDNNGGGNGDDSGEGSSDDCITRVVFE